MRISKETIKEIEGIAREYFQGASGCHDWTHVEWVRNVALRIASKEGADRGIVEIAALLHDIGRKEEMKNRGAVCHAEEGAIHSRRILKRLGFDEETIEAVVHCVRAHRYRNEHIPQTVEAKSIFDADKLDSIGAVGVARDFLFAGRPGLGNLYTGNEKKLAATGKDYSYTEEDSAVLEYEVKLKHIKEKMLTKTGKAIARDRHLFMKQFFARFWREVQGKA
jgi:uncharacterized protein